MYTLSFFFFTTLSSPIAPFWNRISLKCVCVCSPACLSDCICACWSKKRMMSSCMEHKLQWLLLQRLLLSICADYHYSSTHISVHRIIKNERQDKKKKCSKMKMLTDTLRWLFSGFLSLSLFSSSMLFFFYIKYAKDIYSKSTRRVVALLFRFSSLHSPPLLLLSPSVFLIRFFFSFFHTALLKGHYLLSNNIIIIIIV